MATILCIAAIYFATVLAMRDMIKKDIDYYLYYSWGSNPSQTAHNFVSTYKNEIINTFSVIFPIYLGYKFGCQYGISLYKILVDYNYENRIIAWLF